MDTRTLGYFLAVAQEGNVTRTASLLHVTQPTLSRQIQQLEKEVGARLFDRTNHSVELTPEGRAFRARAEEIVELASRAVAEANAEDEELAGIVAVGCNELRSMAELAQDIARFQEGNPQVRFNLVEGDNESIIEGMESGVLDFGLLLEPVPTERLGFLRMSARERWGALVHKDHPLATQRTIRPGDLVGTKVVTVRVNTPVHRQLAAWSGEHVGGMAYAVTYDSLTCAAMVARAKHGAAVCLDIDFAYDEMRFVPLEPELACTSILAWKNGRALPAPAAAFLAFARARR